MRGFGVTLVVLVGVLVLAWLVGQAMGFEFSLLGSLGLSLLLTIVLNVVLAGLSRRRR